MISVRVFGTPVKIKPVILVNILSLWGAATWYSLYQHPDRSFQLGLLMGFLALILLLVADFGHAIAHIFSARYAGSPMDEILLSAGMPRTLYSKDDVPPVVHRMRALGGPVFSLIGLVLSSLIFAITVSGSIGRELALWSLVGHAFIFAGCLLPLPIVDGGSIYKWTIVERGKTPAEADEILRRVNWGIGILCGVIGVGLITAQMWIIGLILIGVGGTAILAAVSIIR